MSLPSSQKRRAPDGPLRPPSDSMEPPAAVRADEDTESFSAGLRILGGRDHSVYELKEKLRSRGYGEPSVEAAAKKLGECGYLDDEKFARLVFRSRPNASRRALRDEMVRRGLAASLWEPLVESITDQEEADRALAVALKHSPLSRIASEDKERWMRRLAGHLGRKGFASSVSYRTCVQLEQRVQAEVGQ